MKIKSYYNRGRKRLKKILGRFVPFNTSYKPDGVYRINLDKLADLNPREIKVHSIYRNALTTLEISDELFAACSEYWKPRKSVQTDYLVVEVPNGRIYTDNESSVAVITQNNKVVENVSLSLTGGKVTDTDQNNIFGQQYFTAPARFEGTVFSMLTGGAGLNNIGHWFLDVLPRLHLLRKSGLYDTIDWFYIPSLKYDYQTETLDLIGIPREKIITADEYQHITADCIVASTAPRGNYTLIPKWLCTFIRDTFLPLVEEPAGRPVKLLTAPNIYISRSDSSIRNVLNEKELLEELQPYGFVSVVSSQHSIKEKIKMFSQARVVLSATGAGLISMFFCKPGTKIIEIFNEGFVVEPFYDIANKIGLDYDYIICKGQNKVKNAAQGQREHLIVDTEKVLEILQNTLPGTELDLDDNKNGRAQIFKV